MGSEKRIAAVQVPERIRVTMGGALVKIDDKTLKTEDRIARKDATKDPIRKAEENSFDNLLAVASMNAADKARFQEVATSLENEFLKEDDQ